MYNPGATNNRRKKAKKNLGSQKKICLRCTMSSNTTAVKILTVQQVYIAVKFLLSWNQITARFEMSYAVERKDQQTASITKCPTKMKTIILNRIANIWKHTNAHSLTVSQGQNQKLTQQQYAKCITKLNIATTLTMSHHLMKNTSVGSSQSSQSFSY